MVKKTSAESNPEPQIAKDISYLLDELESSYLIAQSQQQQTSDFTMNLTNSYIFPSGNLSFAFSDPNITKEEDTGPS